MAIMVNGIDLVAALAGGQLEAQQLIELLQGYGGTSSIPGGLITDIRGNTIVGPIPTDSLLANVMEALNSSTGSISVDKVKANVVEAINLSTETASINSAKIGDLEASKITSGNIATEVLLGNVVNAINLSAQNAFINGAKIQEATIGTAHIQDLSVNSAKIFDAAITNAKIANLAVDSAKIANAAITTAKIQDAAIDSAKIKDAAITNAKIAYAAIDSARIQDAAITSAKIAEASIQTAHIEDASIVNAKIHSLDANKITAGDISAERLKANIISAIELSAQNISADKLKATVVDAINLSATSAVIEGAKIAEASITNAHIVGLHASKINAGHISSERIEAGVIEAINANIGSAKIDGAVIGNLQAEIIVAGDISTVLLRANVIEAINTTTETIVIDSAKIGSISSDGKILVGYGGYNLIKNSDFIFSNADGKPLNWTPIVTGANRMSTGTFRWSSNCIYGEIETASTTGYEQELPLDCAGKDFVLTGWAKWTDIEGTESSDGLHIEVRYEYNTGTGGNVVQTEGRILRGSCETGTFERVKRPMSLTPLAPGWSLVSLKVRVFLQNATGSFRVTCLQLEEGGVATAWARNKNEFTGVSDHVLISSDGVEIQGGSLTVTNSNGTVTIKNGNIAANSITTNMISTAGLNASVITSGIVDANTVTISGGDATLNSSGLTISGINSSITLGGGNFSVTGSGNLVAKSGTIGGWKLSTSAISSTNNKMVLDSATGSLTSIDDTDATKYVKLDSNGLQITKGAISVQLDTGIDAILGSGINAGAITIGTLVATESVNVSSGNVLLDGSGIVVSGSSGIYVSGTKGIKIKEGTLEVLNGTDVTEVIVGNYGTGYGIKAGNTILNASGIDIKQGSITLGTKFSVDSTGVLSATGATITGTINSGAGYFGTSANGVSIGSTGLTVKGTGKITNTGNNFTLSSTGITATGGTIGGWTIGATGISSNNLQLNSNGSILAGSSNQVSISASSGINVATGKFTVSLTGSMVAQDATITGNVTATSGSIGGWVIDAHSITGGSLVLNDTGVISSTNFNVDATGKITALNATISGIITTTNITATGGTIGGWTLASNKLSAGVLNLNSDGTITSTNFSMSNNGSITATNATITGNITTGNLSATGGTIGGWTLVANKISAGNISLDSTVGLEKITIGTNIALNSNGSAKLGILNISSTGAISSTNFSIDALGNASLTGSVTTSNIVATGGTIGGWSISTTKLSAGVLNLNSNGSISSTNFSMDTTGKINVTGATVSGTITTSNIVATGGTVGGWTLAPNKLSAGVLSLNSDGSMSSTNFSMDVTGKITATSANITGTITTSNITATGGTIGGWTLASNKLSAGVLSLNSDGSMASTHFSMDTLGRVTAANASISGTLTTANLTATGGTIGGWTIGGTTISKGTAIVLDSTESKISLATGAIEISATTGIKVATDKFTVDLSGALVAKNATIVGNVTATSGTIGGWTVSADRITGGNLTLYSTGVIDSTNFKVDSLGRVTATNATVSGTITTSNITATGGTIGGWTLGVSKLSAGTLNLNSDGSISTTNFSMDTFGSITATNATITGAITTSNITATGGTIAGWTIGASSISKGTNIVLDSTNSKITLANGAIEFNASTGIKVATDKFTVSTTGVLVAKSATITGSITATSGAIGGWTIGATKISAGVLNLNSDGSIGSTNFSMDTLGRITATNATVTGTITTGNITATGGTVGGWSIGSTSISAGVLVLDSTGTITSTNFSMDAVGKITATSATITGTITTSNLSATGGTIGGWTINTTKISAGVLNLNSDGSIAATNFSMNTLGKITATDATISGTLTTSSLTATGGTIGGWTIGDTSISAGALTLGSTGTITSTNFSMDALGRITATSATVSGTITTSNITATGGTIGGWSINTTKISAGVLNLNSDGSIGSTNFSMDTTGKINATSATISGTITTSSITATGGTIGGWTVNTSTIAKGTSIILDSTNSKITLANGAIEFNASTGIKVATNKFTVDTLGNMVSTNATVTGSITATSGTIGGWAASSNKLTSGNISLDATASAQKITIGTNISLNNDGSAKLGKFTIASTGAISSDNFSIDATGNASLTGSITSTSGTIGGWTLAANTLTAGNIVLTSTTGSEKISIGTNIVLNSNGSATLGKLTIATTGAISSTNFNIDASGNASLTGTITANSGTLKTLSVSGALTIGTGGSVIAGNTTLDMNGLLMRQGTIKLGTGTAGPTGDKVYKFYVDSTQGTLYAQGADITGTITSTSGTIGGWSINSGSITSPNSNILLDATNNRIVANNVTIDGSGLSITNGALNVQTSKNGVGSLTLNSTGLYAYTDALNFVKLDNTGMYIIKNGDTAITAITKDGIFGGAFDTTLPNAPVLNTVTASVSTGMVGQYVTIVANWTNPTLNVDNSAFDDGAGCRIYVREGATGLYLCLATTQPGLTSYEVKQNLKPNTSYEVKMTVFDKTGNESAYSNMKTVTTPKDTTIPSQVTGVTGTTGLGSFTIKWNLLTGANNYDIDYYQVDRSTDGTTWTTVSKSYVTFIVDRELSYENTYRYRIRGVDTSGNVGTWSSTYLAGTPSKVGKTDIDAGTITAEHLHITEEDTGNIGISGAGITAGSVSIDSRGIIVTNGAIDVTSSEGTVLIKDGALKVNGLDVGIAQSENGIVNGSFRVTDTTTGIGDIYINDTGLSRFGAKYWINKRSSMPTYANVMQQADWFHMFSLYPMEPQDIIQVIQYQFLNNNGETILREKAKAINNQKNVEVLITKGYGVPSPTASQKSTIEAILDEAMDNWINTWGVGVTPAYDTVGYISSQTPRLAAVGITIAQDIQSVVTAIVVASEILKVSTKFLLDDSYKRVCDKCYSDFVNLPLGIVEYNNIQGKRKLLLTYVAPKNQTVGSYPVTLGHLYNTVYSIQPLTNKIVIPFGVDTSNMATALTIEEGISIYPILDSEILGGNTFYQITPFESKHGRSGLARLGVFGPQAEKVSIEQDLPGLINYTGDAFKDYTFTLNAMWDSIYNSATGNTEVCKGASGNLSFEVIEMMQIRDGSGKIIPDYDVVTCKQFQLSPTVAIPTSTVESLIFINSINPIYIASGSIPPSITPMLSISYSDADFDATSCKLKDIKSIMNGFTRLFPINPDHVLVYYTYLMQGLPIPTGNTWDPAQNPIVYKIPKDTSGNTTLDPALMMTIVAPNVTVRDSWRSLLASQGLGSMFTVIANNSADTGMEDILPNIVIDDVPVDQILSDMEMPTTYDGRTLKMQRRGDTISIAVNEQSGCQMTLFGVLDDFSSTAAVLANGVYYSTIDGASTGFTRISHTVTLDTPGEYIMSLVHRAQYSSTQKSQSQAQPPTLRFDRFQVSGWRPVHEVLASQNLVGGVPTIVNPVELSNNSSVFNPTIESGSTKWNPVHIVPRYSNSTVNGVPVLPPGTPIMYRVIAKVEKTASDNLRTQAIITGCQAELGTNPSYIRDQWGEGGFPTWMIQEYDPTSLVYSGIKTKHLENYLPRHYRETGIQTRHIADGQITPSKIAQQAVVARHISDGNVGYYKSSYRVRVPLVQQLDQDVCTYPLITLGSTDPSVRYLQDTLETESECVYWRGQLLYPGLSDDYTCERCIVGVHPEDLYAYQGSKLQGTLDTDIIESGQIRCDVAIKFIFNIVMGPSDRLTINYWSEVQEE